MSGVGAIALSLGVLAFALYSRRFESGIVTLPLFFTALGLIIGGDVLGLTDLDMSAEVLHVLAELTLILVLFNDASRIDLRTLARERGLPIRLLGISMPLTIILGAAAALLMFGQLSLWEAAVLAAILAPTDAALGQAVVSNERVPLRIRQALNVESGLNDGIALPAILIFISLAAGAHGDGQSAGAWAEFVGLQLVLGPVVGAAVGLVGGRLLQAATARGWVTGVFQKISVLALALLCFAAAESLGGNGFIAAFVGGLAMGNFARDICPRLWEFGEAEGQVLALLTFAAFGAIMLPIAVDAGGWMIVIYALVSLTVVRMLPTAISVVGLKLQPVSQLFLGWFGPRGLASILFGLILLEESEIAGGPLIIAIVTTTVGLSILLHGISAAPLANRYGAHCARIARPESPEMASVTEMPLRVKSSSEA
jgi:sodium/hydrogen antiporter